MDFNKDIFQKQQTNELHKITTWRNDTQEVCRMALHDIHESVNYIKRVGNDEGVFEKVSGNKTRNGAFLNVEITPGETKQLPSYFDNAIQTLDFREDPVTHKRVYTNKIIGGACPWLTRVGQEELEMEEYLDWKSAAQMEELNKLADKLKKQKAREMALKEVEEMRKTLDAAQADLESRVKKTAKK